MGGIAPALDVLLMDVVAANPQRFRLGIDQPTGAEVAHRQRARQVREVGDQRRAEGLVALHRRLLTEEVPVLLHSLHDLLAIVKGRHPGLVDDDGLHPFRSEHRTHAAASRDAGRPVLGVADRDPGQQTLVFAHRTAQGETHLLPVAGVESFGGGKIAETEQVVGGFERDGPVFSKVDDRPVVGDPS